MIVVGRPFALCGDMPLVAPALLPSWTDLFIFGTITMTANMFYGFVNSNLFGTETNIRVFGPGTIDGGVTVFAGSQRKPLHFKNVANLVIEGVTAINAGTHCISVDTCTNPTIHGNTCRNAGDDLISVLNSTGWTVDNNDLSVTRSDGGGSGCIEIEDSSGNAHWRCSAWVRIGSRDDNRVKIISGVV